LVGPADPRRVYDEVIGRCCVVGAWAREDVGLRVEGSQGECELIEGDAHAVLSR
jgi:hypothetical protein